MQTTLLTSGCEAELHAFLRQSPDTTMFLRSNLERGGISYHGEVLQAEYWGGRGADGSLCAVVAHAWNGSLLLDARARCAAMLEALQPRLARPVHGLVGSWQEVVCARRVLGLDKAPTSLDSHEQLMALDLASLAVPAGLARGEVRCRPSATDDLPLLVRWRVAYSLEVLGAQAGPKLTDGCRRGVARTHEQGLLWVLEADGQPVAMTGFNATLPDCVQIGGVFTPEDLRCRGYARAAVAGSLLAARAEGVERALLFTESPAAHKAYAALGFTRVGEYGIVLFKEKGATST